MANMQVEGYLLTVIVDHTDRLAKTSKLNRHEHGKGGALTSFNGLI